MKKVLAVLLGIIFLIGFIVLAFTEPLVGAVTLALSVISLIILVNFAHEAAKAKKQATYVAQETFEFVMGGDNPYGGKIRGIILNSLNYRYTGDYIGDNEIPYAIEYWDLLNPKVSKEENGRKVSDPEKWKWGSFDPSDPKKKIEGVPVVEVKPLKHAIVKKEILKKQLGAEPEIPLLQKKFGWRYVSIFWPAVHILRFIIERARLVSGGTSASGEVRGGHVQRKVRELVDRSTSSDKPKEVEFFLCRSVRPIVVTDVEFADTFTADMIVMVALVVVLPGMTIPRWKDKFYSNVEEAIRGAVARFCATITWNDFLLHVDVESKQHFFKAMSRLNLQLIPEFGVEMIDAWVPDRELSGDSARQLEALKSMETKRLEGDAKILEQTKAGDAQLALAERLGKAEEAKARGEADAIRLRAKAQADGLKDRITAATGMPEALIEQLQVERVGAYQGNVYAEKGAGMGIMVDGSKAPPPPPPPPTPPPKPSK